MLADKYSEHGLGHLADPRPLDQRDRPLAADIWQHILDAELGGVTDEPRWFARPAVTQRTVSTPRLLRLLRGRGNSDSRLRPYSFCVHAIIHPDEPAGADCARFDLVAPYERDPARWTSVQWADAESGRPHRIATSPFGGAEAIRVKSIRDIVTLYRRKREAKSLGPDGTVCARETVGLLRRRPVRDLTIRHIGKEANEVEDLVAGLAAADDVTQTLLHKGRGIYPQLILPALNVVPETRLAEISGVPRRTIDGLRAGRRPTRRVARLVGDALEQLSRESVVADPAPPAMAALAAWRDTGYAVACLQCSQPIVPGRRRYCSNRCRQAAYRHGQRQVPGRR